MSRRHHAVLPALAWLHRWASILVCLLLAMWFASGAIMLFVPFPSLDPSDDLQRREPLDVSNVEVAPTLAAQQLPDATAARLTNVDGRPTWILSAPGVPAVLVDGGTGRRIPPPHLSAVHAHAERYTGHSVAAIDANVYYDQWVVHQNLDSARPFYRVRMLDEAGTVLYISSLTGLVVQRTNTAQRRWNGVGSVLHWIYFTPVRRHWSVWDWVVWWLSLAAVVAAASGFVTGLWRYVQGRRTLGRGLALYRGWWQWHHVLGISAGVFLLAWIVSGWLSMDHGRLFSGSAPGAQEQARYRGMELAQALSQLTLEELHQWRAEPGLRELQFYAVGGRMVTVARLATGGRRTRIHGDASVRNTLPMPLLLAAAHSIWPSVSTEDIPPAAIRRFYQHAESLPPDAVVLSERPSGRHLWIDAASGEILAVMDGSRRAYAWAWYALHTWRLPGMEGRNALRRAAMLVPLAAGLGLSITGIVLAFRRLRVLAQRTGGGVSRGTGRGSTPSIK